MYDRGSRLKTQLRSCLPLARVPSAVEVEQEEEETKTSRMQSSLPSSTPSQNPPGSSSETHTDLPPPLQPTRSLRGPGTMFVMVAERRHSPPARYPEALARVVQ